jgi:opacity protein-like surface antigen
MKMRRLTLFVPAAFTAATAFADLGAQQRVVPYFGAGLASGTGDLSDDTDNGWLVYGGIGFPVGKNRAVSIGVTLGYAHIPYLGGFEEATNVTSLVGELGYLVGASSPGRVKPYVRGGLGMIQRRYDPGDTGYESSSESDIGFSAGAGLNFVFNSTTFFLGGHIVSTADAGFLAFHGGLSFPGRRRAPPTRR